MHEKLMQKFGVPARKLPMLYFSHHGKLSAHVEPRDLWIIGANERLDLFSGSSHYMIIDVAENFSPPDWRIAPLTDRRRLEPLNQETFVAVL